MSVWRMGRWMVGLVLSLVVGLLTSVPVLAAPVFVGVQPADDTVTANATVVLSGTVTGALTVDVDGVATTLAGGSFTTPSLALAEGSNSFVLTATAVGGGTTQRVHRIVRDSTSPQITVQQPSSGAVVAASPLAVSGIASDAHLQSVTVDGITATLDGASFSAAVALTEGASTVTVSATDSVGNSSQATFDVTLDTGLPTLQITESGAALPDGAVFNRSVTPVITASDATAITLDLQLDGQAFVSGTSVAVEGSHVLAASATLVPETNAWPSS